MARSEGKITLPVSVVSPTDIARLSREIESIDEYFRQAALRQSGDQSAMPRPSKLMDQLVTENQLNLLQEPDRERVLETITDLQQNAPIMHISFSVDPPGSHVQKIVAWLRANVDQNVLVTVGLQPNIGAGCVVRTTNKLFDLSLREYFAQKKDFFVEKLHQAIADNDGTAPVEQEAEAPEEPVAVEGVQA